VKAAHVRAWSRSGLYLVLGLVGGGAAHAQLAPQASVVVNECESGPNGWIELLNRGSERVDLATTPWAAAAPSWSATST
jgi:hypothetical protein